MDELRGALDVRWGDGWEMRDGIAVRVEKVTDCDYCNAKEVECRVVWDDELACEGCFDLALEQAGDAYAIAQGEAELDGGVKPTQKELL